MEEEREIRQCRGFGLFCVFWLSFRVLGSCCRVLRWGVIPDLYFKITVVAVMRRLTGQRRNQGTSQGAVSIIIWKVTHGTRRELWPLWEVAMFWKANSIYREIGYCWEDTHKVSGLGSWKDRFAMYREMEQCGRRKLREHLDFKFAMPVSPPSKVL